MYSTTHLRNFMFLKKMRCFAESMRPVPLELQLDSMFEPLYPASISYFLHLNNFNMTAFSESLATKY